MKKTLLAASAVLAAAFALADAAPSKDAEEARPLKVLVIGNSFSVSLMAHFPACAKSAGCPLDLVCATIGGSPLKLHAENVKSAKKPYKVNWSYASLADQQSAPFVSLLEEKKGVKFGALADLLKAEKWDVVTIQQQSMAGAKADTFEPWAGQLVKAIRELAPTAEIVLQQTWAYNENDKRYGPESSIGAKPEEMFAKLEKNYADFSARYGNLRVIRTGKAIQLYRERRPADAVKDDCVSGGPDTKHLNEKGKYLQACVWLQTLFPKADVTQISYNGEFKPDFAKLARACARDAAAK